MGAASSHHHRHHQGLSQEAINHITERSVEYVKTLNTQVLRGSEFSPDNFFLVQGCIGEEVIREGYLPVVRFVCIDENFTTKKYNTIHDMRNNLISIAKVLPERYKTALQSKTPDACKIIRVGFSVDTDALRQKKYCGNEQGQFEFVKLKGKVFIVALIGKEDRNKIALAVLPPTTSILGEDYNAATGKAAGAPYAVIPSVVYCTHAIESLHNIQLVQIALKERIRACATPDPELPTSSERDLDAAMEQDLGAIKQGEDPVVGKSTVFKILPPTGTGSHPEIHLFRTFESGQKAINIYATFNKEIFKENVIADVKFLRKDASGKAIENTGLDKDNRELIRKSGMLDAFIDAHLPAGEDAYFDCKTPVRDLNTYGEALRPFYEKGYTMSRGEDNRPKTESKDRIPPLVAEYAFKSEQSDTD